MSSTPARTTPARGTSTCGSGAASFGPGAASTQRQRNVYFGRRHGLLPTPVLARAALAGCKHRGPLIVQEYDTSVVVPPDCAATLDAHTNIVLDIGPS